MKEQKPPEDISFHYTNEAMVKDLLTLVPLKASDTVLDAGSGKNKVWFNNIKRVKAKYECEIEDGFDFMDWEKRVDWVVGNPPFHQGWLFLEKASKIANKGIAFLGNLNFWNCLTTRRLEILREMGFEIQRIHIVNDKRWFGRYYFIVISKTPNSLLSWKTGTYS